MKHVFNLPDILVESLEEQLILTGPSKPANIEANLILLIINSKVE